jgi:hypothetical protein
MIDYHNSKSKRQLAANFFDAGYFQFCRRGRIRAFGKDERKDRDTRESDSTSLAYRRVPAVCIGHLMRSVRSPTAGQCPLVGSACCERSIDRMIAQRIRIDFVLSNVTAPG